MQAIKRTLAAAAIMAMAAGSLAAQDTDDGGAVLGIGGLSLGEEAGMEGAGEIYVADTFNDWNLRCERNPAGADPCQMQQLLSDSDGTPTAEIMMFNLPEGSEAVAGATIITPLETLLPAQLTLSTDGAQPRRYPFTFCTAIGCIAQVGFTAAEIDAFRRGSAVQMTIVPVVAPDQPVNLTISLMGFTAAYAAMVEANAALD